MWWRWAALVLNGMVKTSGDMDGKLGAAIVHQQGVANGSVQQGPKDSDTIIAAVKRGHQALDPIHWVSKLV